MCVVDPGGNSVLEATVGKLHFYFDSWELRNFCWYFAGPLPEAILESRNFYFFAMVLSSFPAIEVPEDRDASGAGSPLSVHKNAIFLVDTVSLVAEWQLIETAFSLELGQSLVDQFSDLGEVFLGDGRRTLKGWR